MNRFNRPLRYFAIGAVLMAPLALVYSCQKASAQTAELLLYGGKSHQTFLGCLNCPRSSPKSVCSGYGVGSTLYTDSIWYKYGDFGSKYSDLSPWNKYASEPPVIVDQFGRSYGYLTASRYFPSRTKIEPLLKLIEVAIDAGIPEARAAMCDP